MLKVSLNATPAGAEAVPPPGSVHPARPASSLDTGVSAAYTPSGPAAQRPSGPAAQRPSGPNSISLATGSLD